MTVTGATTGQFEIGRVIQRTFGAIGRNLPVFLGLTLILRAVPVLVTSLMQYSATGFMPGQIPNMQSGLFSPTQHPFGPLAWLASGLVSIVTTYMLQAALMRGTVADLNGKRASLGELLSTSVAFILPLFGLAVAMGVAVFVGFALLIVPGVMMACAWVAAGPAIVIERKGVFEAFSRSAELTRGHRWSIFALFILFAIFSWILSAVFLGAIFGAISTGSATATAVSLVVGAAISAVTGLIGAAGVAAIYYELRSSKEGVGVESLASVFD